MAEWQQRLANVLAHGDASALPEVLVLMLALIACSVFGLIQFFTMLGTRWGDKNPAPKSLLLSVLVHVVILLAWSTAMIVRPARAVMALPSETAVPIPIHELIEDEPEDNFDSGNTQIWQKLQDLPDPELARQERPLNMPEELAAAPRAEVEPPPPAMNPDDLTNPTAEPDVSAQPEISAGVAELTKPAPVAVEQPMEPSSAEARPDVGIGAAPQRQDREAEPDETPEPPKTRGSETPIPESRPDDLAMTLPVESAIEANPIPEGSLSETIRKGAAPTPSNAPDAEFTPDGRTDANGNPSFSRANSLRRTDSKLPDDAVERSAAQPREVPYDGLPLLDPGKILSSAEPVGPAPTPTLAPAVGPNLPNRSPATYKLRKLEQRRGTALRHGGSLESEKAVEYSLKWLASVQERDGHWDSSKYGGGSVDKDPEGNHREKGGRFADSGVTGLALLAFMGAGYTPDDGDYADNVDRGLKWIVRQQRQDGYLGGQAVQYDQMYCHAIATFALGEACGMLPERERPPELRRALASAVDFIVERQAEDGGWRYEKNQDGDMSMFGWQLMALKSADIAGVKAQPEVWQKMIRFLKRRSLGDHDGLAAYSIFSGSNTPTPAMTAEALFCKQMIGIRRTNPACEEAVGYLLQHLPKITEYDEYYWYYGTLAMFQHGGEPWTQWNDAQRDLIVRLQETRGPYAGSWDPKGKWAGLGGRIYSTALSTLCLEVYYRYLPLYQGGVP
jgi:hypothetical protein